MKRSLLLVLAFLMLIVGLGCVGYHDRDRGGYNDRDRGERHEDRDRGEHKGDRDRGEQRDDRSARPSY